MVATNHHLTSVSTSPEKTAQQFFKIPHTLFTVYKTLSHNRIWFLNFLRKYFSTTLVSFSLQFSSTVSELAANELSDCLQAVYRITIY